MERSVAIGGSDGRVVLTFPAHSSPDDWDPYHLEAKVAVETWGKLDRGEFQARVYGGFFFPPVLRALAADLDALLTRATGEFAFASEPHGLECRIQLEAGKGLVGGAVSSSLDRNELKFSFETDQSYLQATARELASLIATFPAE
jgi:hypothetical protein